MREEGYESGVPIVLECKLEAILILENVVRPPKGALKVHASGPQIRIRRRDFGFATTKKSWEIFQSAYFAIPNLIRGLNFFKIYCGSHYEICRV